MSEAPTLDYERRFRSSGARLLAGIDEVGRGALAGPVSVGIAVVDLQQQKLLADVRDSKLLKVADRERLVPLVRDWSVASAVGHASANEIDELGIIAALRLAGNRAWFAVLAAGVRPEVVLLDGSHNWLSPDLQPSLFDDAPAEPGCDAPVHTLVKADMQCLSVAAASHHREGRARCDDVRAAHPIPGLRLGREQGLRHRSAQGGAARPPVPRRTTGSAGSCSLTEPLCRRRRGAAGRRAVARGRRRMVQDGTMSAEDLENYETDMELQLYREYRDVVGLFSYVVETERRFYLANHVDLQARSADGEVYFDLTLQDAWVWDVYRSARFVKSVRVITFKDVNVEELPAQRGTRPAQGRGPGQLTLAS